MRGSKSERGKKNLKRRVQQVVSTSAITVTQRSAWCGKEARWVRPVSVAAPSLPSSLFLHVIHPPWLRVLCCECPPTSVRDEVKVGGRNASDSLGDPQGTEEGSSAFQLAFGSGEQQVTRGERKAGVAGLGKAAGGTWNSWLCLEY